MDLGGRGNDWTPRVLHLCVLLELLEVLCAEIGAGVLLNESGLILDRYGREFGAPVCVHGLLRGLGGVVVDLLEATTHVLKGEGGVGGLLGVKLVHHLGWQVNRCPLPGGPEGSPMALRCSTPSPRNPRV